MAMAQQGSHNNMIQPEPQMQMQYEYAPQMSMQNVTLVQTLQEPQMQAQIAPTYQQQQFANSHQFSQRKVIPNSYTSHTDQYAQELVHVDHIYVDNSNQAQMKNTKSISWRESNSYSKDDQDGLYDEDRDDYIDDDKRRSYSGRKSARKSSSRSRRGNSSSRREAEEQTGSRTRSKSYSKRSSSRSIKSKRSTAERSSRSRRSKSKPKYDSVSDEDGSWNEVSSPVGCVNAVFDEDPWYDQAINVIKGTFQMACSAADDISSDGSDSFRNEKKSSRREKSSSRRSRSRR